jgi:hypothetical protein
LRTALEPASVSSNRCWAVSRRSGRPGQRHHTAQSQSQSDSLESRRVSDSVRMEDVPGRCASGIENLLLRRGRRHPYLEHVLVSAGLILSGIDDTADAMFAYLHAEIGDAVQAETLRRFVESSPKIMTGSPNTAFPSMHRSALTRLPTRTTSTTCTTQEARTRDASATSSHRRNAGTAPKAKAHQGSRSTSRWLRRRPGSGCALTFIHAQCHYWLALKGELSARVSAARGRTSLGSTPLQRLCRPGGQTRHLRSAATSRDGKPPRPLGAPLRSHR